MSVLDWDAINRATADLTPEERALAQKWWDDEPDTPRTIKQHLEAGK